MAAPRVDENGEVWLDSQTAARVLGFSTQYLGRLAIAEGVPARREEVGHPRWWFRRRYIEQLAAVRALQSQFDDDHRLPA